MLNFINKFFTREEKNIGSNSISNNTSNDNFMRRSSTNSTANLISTNKTRTTGSLARRETKEDLPAFVNNGLQQIDNYAAKLEPHNNTNNTGRLLKSNYDSNNNTDSNLPVFDVNAELNKELALHISSDTNPFYIDSEVLSLISSTVAIQYEIIPVNKTANQVVIYFANEMQKSKAGRLLTSLLPTYKIDWQNADKELINQLIKVNYFQNNGFDERPSANLIAKNLETIKDKFSSTDTSVVFDYSSASVTEQDERMHQVVSSIIGHAVVELNATDIDIDNNQEILASGRTKSETVIRARVDGLMRELARCEIPIDTHNSLPRALKVYTGKNSVDDQSSASGVIKATLRHGKKVVPIELRCQFMPSQDRGIAVSIRVQKKHDFSLDLDNLGLLRYQRQMFDDMLTLKNGVIFFNGSVNRGKSSTQVAFLKAYQQKYPTKNVVLVEDVREFILKDIRQVEILHNKNSKDVEEALLRFNPDMIAFGETRNEKMTETIMRLAEIGHLMSSTVHAKSATTVYSRLIDLGIPRYKIAGSLRVSVSQLLIRKICSNCIRVEDKSYKKIPQFANYLENLNVSPTMKFYTASGKVSSGQTCHVCQGSGYSGRTGIFEILPISTRLREMILDEQCTEQQFRLQALQEGFQSLWMNGLRKVIMGETTIEELLEVMEIPNPTDEGLNLNLEFNTDSYEIEDVLN